MITLERIEELKELMEKNETSWETVKMVAGELVKECPELLKVDNMDDEGYLCDIRDEIIPEMEDEGDWAEDFYATGDDYAIMAAHGPYYLSELSLKNADLVVYTYLMFLEEKLSEE